MATQILESLKSSIFVVENSISQKSTNPKPVFNRIAYSIKDKQLYRFNGSIWEQLLINDLNNYTKSEIDAIISQLDLDSVIEKTNTVKPANVTRIQQLLNIATPDSVNVVKYNNEEDTDANGIIVASTKIIKYYTLIANEPKTLQLGKNISELKLISGTNVVNIIVNIQDGNIVIEVLTGNNIFTLDTLSGNLLIITSSENAKVEVSYINE